MARQGAPPSLGAPRASVGRLDAPGMTRSGTLEMSLDGAARAAQGKGKAGNGRTGSSAEGKGASSDGTGARGATAGDGVSDEDLAAASRRPSTIFDANAVHRGTVRPSPAGATFSSPSPSSPSSSSSSSSSKPPLSTSTSSARLRSFLRPSTSTSSAALPTVPTAPAMQKSASADAPRPRARTPLSMGAAPRERPQSMLWGSTSAVSATRAANEPPRPTSPSPTRWRRPLLPTRGAPASAALSDGAATARRGHGHGHGHGRSTSLGSVLTLARGARAPTTAEVAREPPQQLPPLRKKTSLAAMKTLLAASTGGKNGDHPRATGKERAAETETVTDEELAAWREAGRAKRAGNNSLGSRVELGERMGETGEGVAAGEEEDEVLIIRSRGSGDKVDTAPGFSPTRLPYGMDAPPFSSLIPSPSHSPRPASPPASSRRSSNAPSIAFSPSRRPSDGSVLVSASRRPSDSPAPVAPAARPKTPTPRLDPGALNVLEFVAVDEGGKGDEEIPLRFPQTSGAEPEGGLAPSAISSFPPPLRRSSSSTSSRLSLGSEEGMVLSLLDGDGDASALLFPSSPQLGGTSPVPGARPLIAPKPAPESSLPPSMQHLFATPGAPRRPGSAAGGGQGAPLSSPSRRAAAPAPIRVRSPSPRSSPRRTSTGDCAGLGFALPGSPPPRPPRSPGRTSSSSRLVSPGVNPPTASAWSPLAATTGGAPRSASTPPRPRRTAERARSSGGVPGADAGAEGARGGAWTPPPTPPGSEKVR